MAINEMITKIIRRYGFEHKYTIKFCSVVEVYEETDPDIQAIKHLFDVLISLPEEEKEDEED